MTQNNTDLFGNPVYDTRLRVSKGQSKSAKRSLFDELNSPGRFIMKRSKCYCIYEGKMVPVLVLSVTQYWKIYPVLKRLKNGREVISLQQVRRQHGNSEIKKQYKAHRAKIQSQQN
jgi:hypothetical protein